MNDFVSLALEPSTRDRYAQALKPLRAFCAELKETFPPSALVIAAFIKHRSEKGYAISTIRGARAAVGDLFRFGTDPSPADDPLVSAAMKAAQKFAPPEKPKDPLTRDLLLKIWAEFDRFSKEKGSTLLPARRRAFLRDFAMAIVAYRGCLRGDEVVNIRSDEFWFGPIPATPAEIKSRGYPPSIARAEFVFLFINSSKTNPQKQKALSERVGNTVTFGHDDDSRLDPAAVIKAWLKVRDPNASHLFHSDNKSNPLSTAKFSEAIKERAKLAGLLVDLSLSGHSLRAGCATDASRVTDINCLRSFGRWRSDCVLRYIRDNHHAAISVSIGLGSSAAAAAAVPLQPVAQRPRTLITARPSSLANLPPPKLKK